MQAGSVHCCADVCRTVATPDIRRPPSPLSDSARAEDPLIQSVQGSVRSSALSAGGRSSQQTERLMLRLQGVPEGLQRRDGKTHTQLSQLCSLTADSVTKRALPFFAWHSQMRPFAPYKADTRWGTAFTATRYGPAAVHLDIDGSDACTP
jgi:hypothetical protein